MSTVELPLSQGLIAVIDVVDLPLVAQHKWCASVGKWGTYAVTNVTKVDGRRTMLKLHRLITGARPGELVDHRDHDGLNNRRTNLRVCSTSQNGANTRAWSTNPSGYKGVTWHKQRGRWRASITVNRQNRHLGLFTDSWEAAQAYNTAAREAWGEFAFLNERQEFVA